MNKETGGPAYPTNQYANGISPSGHSQGMTLRDHFAGLAMQALLTEIEPGKEQQILLVPQLAYSLSDEMLKARDK